MPKPIDDTKDDDQSVPVTPIDLDRVHEQTVNKLDAEVANPDDEPKDDPIDDEPKDDIEPKDDVKDDTPDPTPDPTPAPKQDDPEPDAPIELDTDITKEGKGKIAVKDSDGNTFYFNNMDEVPDDFEPSTYKEWGVFTSKMAVKSQEDAQAARDSEIAKAQKAQQAEIDAVTSRWDQEQGVMVKAGMLPTDAKQREEEVTDTYVYISKKLEEGVVIESFAEAHKARKFEESQKKKAEVRRDKGAKVMGGNGGAPDKREHKPLPAGTSLDAVHARYSGLI